MPNQNIETEVKNSINFLKYEDVENAEKVTT